MTPGHLQSLPGRVAGPAVALLLLASTAGAQVPLDHFMCYPVSGPNVNTPVQLEDQFDKMHGIIENVTVTRPNYFCNPTMKIFEGVVTNIVDRTAHLKWYRIVTTKVPEHKIVVRNQFGANQTLSVGQPRWLAVPTQKDTLPRPEDLDHFKCYPAKGPSISKPVTLEDQFERDKDFTVLRPVRFCNPVVKRHGTVVVNIRHPEAHLVCYDVARQFRATNQFGVENLLVRKMDVCVPSQKLSVN
jgi:hypothetical protein